MALVLAFATAHPWLFSFSFTVLGCLSVVVFYLLVNRLLYWLFKVTNHFLRMLNILFRGWPPPHLDADGDVFVSLVQDQPPKPKDRCEIPGCYDAKEELSAHCRDHRAKFGRNSLVRS